MQHRIRTQGADSNDTVMFRSDLARKLTASSTKNVRCFDAQAKQELV